MSLSVSPTPLRRLRWTLLSTPSKTLELLALTPDDPAGAGVSFNIAEPMGLGEAEFSKRVSQRLNSNVLRATAGITLAMRTGTRTKG
jgi:hypothetical protein